LHVVKQWGKSVRANKKGLHGFTTFYYKGFFNNQQSLRRAYYMNHLWLSTIATVTTLEGLIESHGFHKFSGEPMG
jgi:hypothetical protein